MGADVLEKLLLRVPMDFGPRFILAERFVEVRRERGLRYLASHMRQAGILEALERILRKEHPAPIEADRDLIRGILATARMQEPETVAEALLRARDLGLEEESDLVEALLVHDAPRVRAAARAWLAWFGCRASRVRVREGLISGSAEELSEVARWTSDPEPDDAPWLIRAFHRATALWRAWSGEPDFHETPRDVLLLFLDAVAATGTRDAMTELLRLAMAPSRRFPRREAARKLADVSRGVRSRPARGVWGEGESPAARIEKAAPVLRYVARVLNRWPRIQSLCADNGSLPVPADLGASCIDGLVAGVGRSGHRQACPSACR